MLQAQLKDSVMTDARGRTGYIASNYQLQFDNPAGGRHLHGGLRRLRSNRSLALGARRLLGMQVRRFWNLYDRSWAEQCSPVDILVLPCEEGTEAEPAPVPTEGGGDEVRARRWWGRRRLRRRWWCRWRMGSRRCLPRLPSFPFARLTTVRPLLACSLSFSHPCCFMPQNHN